MQETWDRSLGWEDPLESGKRKGYPLQYSCLENSMDCVVHGVAKSRTRLSDFHFPLAAAERKARDRCGGGGGGETGQGHGRAGSTFAKAWTLD